MALRLLGLINNPVCYSYGAIETKKNSFAWSHVRIAIGDAA